MSCEGCEFDVLDALHPRTLRRINALEVQFHYASVRNVSETWRRYCGIERNLLLAGFMPTYRVHWLFELWERHGHGRETLWREEHPEANPVRKGMYCSLPPWCTKAD